MENFDDSSGACNSEDHASPSFVGGFFEIDRGDCFMRPSRVNTRLVYEKKTTVPRCPVDDPRYIPAFLQMVHSALLRSGLGNGDSVEICPRYFVTKDGTDRFFEFICALCNSQWFTDNVVVINCQDGPHVSNLILGLKRDMELFTGRGYRRAHGTKSISVVPVDEYRGSIAAVCISAYFFREKVAEALGLE